jgi:hypothetical protein
MSIRLALSILWAAPTSMVGVALGTAALLSGGCCRRNSRVLEFHGGALRWIPTFTPVRAAAMAIGHVIVAIDEPALDASRDHELVHVRQAELWGTVLPSGLLRGQRGRLGARTPLLRRQLVRDRRTASRAALASSAPKKT